MEKKFGHKKGRNIENFLFNFNDEKKSKIFFWHFRNKNKKKKLSVHFNDFSIKNISWSLGYPSAALNTKQAGECIGQFLMGMEENNEGFKAVDVHVIGFSLGAHVASFASE